MLVPPSAGTPPAPGAPPNANSKIVGSIQALPGWTWCTARLNGSACASGAGNAISSIQQNQASPSTDKKSAKFNIAGRTGYSNALWWKSIGANSNSAHFAYDLWFYIDRPDVSEALEFDVNQSFGGIRYTWGTECSFKNTGKWDIWDPAGFKWIPTNIDCTPFSANAWHHLVWQFERANHQVHYVSLTIDNQTIPVDIYKDPQTNWKSDDVNVAFQMDGDIRQDPYNVWLDQITLTQW
ncbi:MAG TPA: hypothetical protein VJN64_14885 [Terriglobales bacterium]|nr:hypothetical protein [Terriglobales bacterium]